MSVEPSQEPPVLAEEAPVLAEESQVPPVSESAVLLTFVAVRMNASMSWITVGFAAFSSGC